MSSEILSKETNDELPASMRASGTRRSSSSLSRGPNSGTLSRTQRSNSQAAAASGFTNLSLREQMSIPGPGSYDIGSYETYRGRSSSPAFSLSSRYSHVDPTRKSNVDRSTPGPGAYNYTAADAAKFCPSTVSSRSCTVPSSSCSFSLSGRTNQIPLDDNSRRAGGLASAASSTPKNIGPGSYDYTQWEQNQSHIRRSPMFSLSGRTDLPALSPKKAATLPSPASYNCSNLDRFGGRSSRMSSLSGRIEKDVLMKDKIATPAANQYNVVAADNIIHKNSPSFSLSGRSTPSNNTKKSNFVTPGPYYYVKDDYIKKSSPSFTMSGRTPVYTSAD